MIAVIVVRDGVLPAGFDEAICEASRRTLLVGSRLSDALDEVGRFSERTWTLETDPTAATAGDLARLAASCLARIAASEATSTRADVNVVIMPSSPDGRDLAPRLAHVLGRPFHAGALSIAEDCVTVSRRGGLHLADVHPRVAFVATLQIGVRGAEPTGNAEHVVVDLSEVDELMIQDLGSRGTRAVQVLEVQPPDASTMDLAEAPRILGGGAGLDDALAFERLQRVASRLGASMGVTRVITDRGWAGHERQIGTTGVVVDPNLYISFGISGAVQHTSGLGHPDHIISVNTDAHCPMMQISDVAIVSDANAVLVALEALLDGEEAS